jgi:hypothetical protein
MNNVNLNENPIRAQLGGPARTSYSLPPDATINWGGGDKMIKIIFFIFITIIPVKSVLAENIKIEMGIVYTAGFYIEYFVPYSESNIEKCLCLGKISKNDFFASILSKNEGFNYNRFDVRAKIIFDKKDVYFVDKQGFVRHNESFYIIDKNKFSKTLQITACKNEKGKLVPWKQ